MDVPGVSLSVSVGVAGGCVMWVCCRCVNFNQFKSVQNSLKFMEDDQEPSCECGRVVKGCVSGRGRWGCHVGRGQKSYKLAHIVCRHKLNPAGK